MSLCYRCETNTTSCKCSCNNEHICIDCNRSDEIRHNSNICPQCEEHCCQLCYNENEITDFIFMCKKCDVLVCYNCVGICWCQCMDCICKNCVTDNDLPICPVCNKKHTIPVCEDASIYCSVKCYHLSNNKD